MIVVRFLSLEFVLTSLQTRLLDKKSQWLESHLIGILSLSKNIKFKDKYELTDKFILAIQIVSLEFKKTSLKKPLKLKYKTVTMILNYVLV